MNKSNPSFLQNVYINQLLIRSDPRRVFRILLIRGVILSRILVGIIDDRVALIRYFVRIVITFNFTFIIRVNDSIIIQLEIKNARFVEVYIERGDLLTRATYPTYRGDSRVG